MFSPVSNVCFHPRSFLLIYHVQRVPPRRYRRGRLQIPGRTWNPSRMLSRIAHVWTHVCLWVHVLLGVGIHEIYPSCMPGRDTWVFSFNRLGGSGYILIALLYWTGSNLSLSTTCMYDVDLIFGGGCIIAPRLDSPGPMHRV